MGGLYCHLLIQCSVLCFYTLYVTWPFLRKNEFPSFSDTMSLYAFFLIGQRAEGMEESSLPGWPRGDLRDQCFFPSASFIWSQCLITRLDLQGTGLDLFWSVCVYVQA